MTARKQPPQRSLRRKWQAFLVGTRKRVPPGLRFLLGLLILCGGILGFLPVLGFWMIPLGIAVMLLDLRPLWRHLTTARRTRQERDR